MTNNKELEEKEAYERRYMQEMAEALLAEDTRAVAEHEHWLLGHLHKAEAQ